MRIFVTGGTGVLGRVAVPGLVGAGHEVVAPGRTDGKRRALAEAGAEPVECDIFDFTAVAEAAASCEALVNLATHIPSPDHAWKRGAWRENDRIRREVSAIAGRVAHENVREVLLRVLVQESIVMNYPDKGADWIDESVPLKITVSTASAAEAEDNALGAARAGVRAVVLRFGLFDASGSAHAEYFERMARRGIAPFAGSPGAYLSGVAITDAASAVVAALDVPTGIYNVVEDEPRTRRERADRLAAAVGRDHLRIFPGSFAKLAGDKRAGAIARSQRVSNAKFKAAAGWAPGAGG